MDKGIVYVLIDYEELLPEFSSSLQSVRVVGYKGPILLLTNFWNQ